MKQIQVEQPFVEQDYETLEKSVGNLFTEFLEKKSALVDFKEWSKKTLISLDGEVLRGEDGFPAKVMDILKMVIKPDQKLKFLPANAGG